MRKSENPQQNLVDLCFSLVLLATDENYNAFLKNKSNDEKADWVRDQLRKSGFNVSDPIGISWGILK
jgi:hypothetical protein